MAYTSLEQRIASGYLVMFPAFVPQEDAAVPAAGQREFYGLMQRLYQLLVDEPELAVPALHQDDACPTRYKKAYGKPELDSWVRKSKQAVDSLLKNMFLLGQGVPVKLNKRQQNILARVGIASGGPLPDAWTWMASRPGADPTAFAYCLFDRDHVYSTGTYARLLGEEPFRKLERWMRSRGYRPYDCYKTDWPDFQLTLAYANPAWSPDRPNVGNEYKVKHTGISAQYDAYVQTPVSLGLCIPGGLKPFLEAFSRMEPALQAFVLEHTKRCDGCRYCVQTDRTGTRPLARVPLSHGGETYALCPYFPGYTYSWNSLDDALTDRLTAFLAFMDGCAADRTACG